MSNPTNSAQAPSVTFFLFAYNQRQYIDDACRAALAQNYTPLEIIFSDDHSTDGTFERMEEIAKVYDGPHKIRLNRNEENLGLIKHVNKSFEISSGNFIVVAAGDDISEPDRVQELVAAYQRSQGQAMVIHSSAMKINEANAELGLFIPPVVALGLTFFEMADSLGLYIGATAAWDRRIYSEFGPIAYRDAYEDLIFGFRAAIKNSLLYVDKPLVKYRVGVGMSTQDSSNQTAFLQQVALKKKILRLSLAVYKQRMTDLSCIDRDENSVENIRRKLSREVDQLEKILLFYESPLKLLLTVFAKNSRHTISIINLELRYLIKTWRRR